MINVAVGSTNPSKIKAVQTVFEQCFSSVCCYGVKANSGVSDQPMSDKETRQGALQRVHHAIELFTKKHPDLEIEFAVGLEGGCEFIPNPIDSQKQQLECFAWMAIKQIPTNQYGFARTASFTLPPPLVDLINEGMELGDADDKLFNRKNSKKEDGSVGILSHGLIDRSKYYEHALILAMIPFLTPSLYNQ